MQWLTPSLRPTASAPRCEPCSMTRRAGRPSAPPARRGRWSSPGPRRRRRTWRPTSAPPCRATSSLPLLPAVGRPESVAEPVTRDWSPPYPIDVPLILSVHPRGARDPAYRTDASGAVWRTVLAPAGPGTLRVTARPAAGGGTRVTAAAWGPGAAWLLETLPSLLGAEDDQAGFAPVHPLLREMSGRHPGARVGRSGRVLEALIPAILEQKVVGAEARRAWRYLLHHFGQPAPGPAPDGMRVFPEAATWGRIPSWEWHRATRLVELSGTRPPRRGPRLAMREHRAF